MAAFTITIRIPERDRPATFTMIAYGTEDPGEARKIAEDYFTPERVVDVQPRDRDAQDSDKSDCGP